MSENTFPCGRCRAICTSEDAVVPAEYPAGWPIPSGVAVDHLCEACWEELGFVDAEEDQ